jgi:hypothetical protein
MAQTKTIKIEKQKLKRFVELLRKAEAYDDEYYKKSECDQDHDLINMILMQLPEVNVPRRKLINGI